MVIASASGAEGSEFESQPAAPAPGAPGGSPDSADSPDTLAVDLAREADELYGAGPRFFNRALAKYAEALALQPRLSVAHVNRASILLETGQRNAALDELDEAISVEQAKPEDLRSAEVLAEAYSQKGAVFFGEGRHMQASRCFERAILAGPAHAERRAAATSMLTATGRLLGDVDSVVDTQVWDARAEAAFGAATAGLCVTVGPSSVAGRGLFALGRFAKGDALWEEVPLATGAAPDVPASRRCEVCLAPLSGGLPIIFHAVPPDEGGIDRETLLHLLGEEPLRPAVARARAEGLLRGPGVECPRCNAWFCCDACLNSRTMHLDSCRAGMVPTHPRLLFHAALRRLPTASVGDIAFRLMAACLRDRRIDDCVKLLCHIPNPDPALLDEEREALTLLQTWFAEERDTQECRSSGGDGGAGCGDASGAAAAAAATSPEGGGGGGGGGASATERDYFRYASVARLNGLPFVLFAPTLGASMDEERVLNLHAIPQPMFTARAVFRVASLMNHSCDANVAVDAPLLSAGVVRFRALRRIAEGDELFFSYLEPDLDPATVTDDTLRRSHLFENHFFWCKCEKCSQRRSR